MLTNKDLNEVKKIVHEETKFLPTKDEFYTKMDELIGEVKSMREEQTVIGGKISEHSDILEGYEKRLTSVEEAVQTSK